MKISLLLVAASLAAFGAAIADTEQKFVTPLIFPEIADYGGVVPLPKAAEQSRKGAKVVFDITADAKPADVNKGLEQVARLLNLYGVAGLKASDVKIALVLHGEGAKSVLTDSAYKAHFGAEKNPKLPLIRSLRKEGVEVFVCGQALHYKKFLETEVGRRHHQCSGSAHRRYQSTDLGVRLCPGAMSRAGELDPHVKRFSQGNRSLALHIPRPGTNRGRDQQVLKERNPINRRELLGVVGTMGAGAALGTSHALADGHGKPTDNKLMAPVGNHHLHFCGIHVAKKDPKIQVVTQHYCGMRGEPGSEMHQCLLYDTVGKGAKLLGVEYIISNELFQKLPEEEKKYWHIHTYEVLGGGLIAPSMTPKDEMDFMKGLLSTWGKTWHTWPDPATPVPMGEPMLMWSLTGDGQDNPKVIAARDKEFGVTTADIRKKRIEAIGYDEPAVPQPKNVDMIGRQWTATGEDKPTPKKK